jgi:arginase
VRVELIIVPFDSGLRDVRMGRGPAHLLELGIAKQLEALGLEVALQSIEPSAAVFPSEIRIAFELQRAVASAVSGALASDAFPLVLSGNCNIAVGVTAGIRTTRGVSPAVCWFDAHADFNTPETTVGGFLDGMAVAMLTGHCWRELTGQVPGFAPIPESQILMLGTRDVDPLERIRLEASRIRIAAQGSTAEADVEAIARAAGAPDVYLHLDLDALDAGEGRANGYSLGGGPSRSELLATIDIIGWRAAIRAASLTAYDPECDAEDRAGHFAIEAALHIVGAALRSR